jgi:hypothetical protein
MLRLRLNREPRRVGRQECKRRLFVLPFLGEIEVHAANQVPGGMAAFEELLHGELGYGQFGIEGRIWRRGERSLQALDERHGRIVQKA